MNLRSPICSKGDYQTQIGHGTQLSVRICRLPVLLTVVANVVCYRKSQLSSANGSRKLRLPSKDLQLLVANGSAQTFSFGCADLGARVHNFASKEKTRRDVTV